MKLLITGASSYVGARLYLDLRQHHDVTGTYHGTKLSDAFIPLDVTDEQQVATVIADRRPDVIIHVASNANAKWCEANPEQALLLNQESARFITAAANTVDAGVFFMSSFAALNSDNLYGRTKQQSEAYVQEAKAGHLILRPSLILGFSPNTANDRPFNRILKNLDGKTPAVYDTSWKFQPTWIGHISQVIIAALDRNIRNTTIPIAVPELKSRYDIAHDILSPFGISVTAVDKQDAMKITTDPLDQLAALGLPVYTYAQIITRIVQEINNRQQYDAGNL